MSKEIWVCTNTFGRLVYIYTHLPKVFVPINNLCHNWLMAEICCDLHEKAHKLVRNIVCLNNA